MSARFFQEYFSYVGDTESPSTYHRWSAISSVAALLGRRVFQPFGHSIIYPNFYTLLVGNPAARKGSALKPSVNVLRAIEYSKLASQRISPERFLLEITQLNNHAKVLLDEVLEVEIEEFGEKKSGEIFVVSDEFSDFIRGNKDFCDMLTNLWDNLPFYKNPKMVDSRSIHVHEPTINIIGATTPQSIALNLPSELIGTGFLSRFILVHAEPTGRYITFPAAPSAATTKRIAGYFKQFMEVRGEVTWTAEGAILFDQVYKHRSGLLEDGRFQHYNGRRHIHLLKLCMIFTVMDAVTEGRLGTDLAIRREHVLQAHTLLAVTEQRMPKALGQFGRAKSADVAHTIIDIIRDSPRVLDYKEIWKKVANDLDKYEQFLDLMKKLMQTEKIKYVKHQGKTGFVATTVNVNGWPEEWMVQEEFLLPEERILL